MDGGRPGRLPADPDPTANEDGADDQEWATLRTAPNQLTAELWRELLQSEGIPAMLAPGDAISFLGLSPAPCRLLVPATLREHAELALAGETWTSQEEER